MGRKAKTNGNGNGESADFENGEIVELLVSNYQKVRMAAIKPNGRPVVMLTGRGAQGKTSILDSMWFALKGTEVFNKTYKDRKTVIRDGAEVAVVTLKLRDGRQREVTVTRRQGQAGNQPPLTVEGKGAMTAQAFLDDLLGALTFDPLEFVKMEPLDQVEELKKLSHVKVDFAEIDALNKADYDERTGIGQQRDLIKGQLAGMRVLAGLPKEKLDTDAIWQKLNRAGEMNEQAQKLSNEKQRLGAVAAQMGVDKSRKESEIELLEEEIRKLQASLKIRQTELKTLESEQGKAEKAFRAAPQGEFVDTVALTTELQNAQRTNEAIDERQRYDQLKAQFDLKEQAYIRLTNQISVRDDKKKEAVAQAKIPVEGLTFDSSHVRYKGRALGNLSGGEQLRISTEIGMASNPKLRIMCIRNGESLDQAGLKAIEALAREHKFQIWMTRLEESGKCGIVIEDGMVAVDNDKGKERAS